MTRNIEMKDMKAIQEIAQRYDMSLVEFGRTIITQTKKRTQRQIRVSEHEYEIISAKAEAKGLNLMRYCDYACNEFLKKKVIDKDYFDYRTYGEGRKKRIAVEFKDSEVEASLLSVADKHDIEIGTLIRYCALTC